MLALKKETHVYYAYFRTYFAGNVDAVDDRLRTLDATIGASAATSLGALAVEIVDAAGDDDARVAALEKLLGGEFMAEFGVLRVVRRRALEVAVARFGADSDQAVDRALALGKAYRKEKNVAEAAPLFRAAFEARTRRLGPEHRATLHAAYYYGVALRYARDFGAAEPLALDTLRRQRAALGDGHEETLNSANHLGALYAATGRHEDARATHARAAAGRAALGPAGVRDALQSRGALAESLSALGRFDEAADLFRETVAAQRQELGPAHPDLLRSHEGLAACREAAGDLDGATAARRAIRDAQRLRRGRAGGEDTAALDALRRKRGRASRCCVVDGGSRGTRCYSYAVEGGSLARAVDEASWELGATLEELLVEARKASDRGGVAAAADKLRNWLEANGAGVDDAVFVGCTAGVRQALHNGRLDDSWLAKVEVELRETFSDLFFETVPAEAEGGFELAATSVLWP